MRKGRKVGGRGKAKLFGRNVVEKNIDFEGGKKKKIRDEKIEEAKENKRKRLTTIKERIIQS